MKKGKSHPRHSLKSLSMGDEGDPQGLLFMGGGLYDLSNLLACGAFVDTLRPIYGC
jgi:hypothetical protein